jgi:hypothetical protein
MAEQEYKSVLIEDTQRNEYEEPNRLPLFYRASSKEEAEKLLERLAEEINKKGENRWPLKVKKKSTTKNKEELIELEGAHSEFELFYIYPDVVAHIHPWEGTNFKISRSRQFLKERLPEMIQKNEERGFAKEELKSYDSVERRENFPGRRIITVGFYFETGDVEFCHHVKKDSFLIKYGARMSDGKFIGLKSKEPDIMKHQIHGGG